MASAQAWEDTDKLRALITVVNSLLDTTIHGDLSELNDLFEIIAGDQNRLSEDVALADTHPVWNSAYLTAEVGKLLTLRAYLIANGYIPE
jgi:hypothetical protein